MILEQKPQLSDNLPLLYNPLPLPTLNKDLSNSPSPLITRCTQDVRVVFSVTRMRSSNSARMNKFDFTTEKIGSVHKTVFEIVAPRNVDNWIQLLT